MRISLALAAALLFPTMASAQEAKSAALADYVSFCLALWEGASDLSAKATALGVQDVTGASGMSMTVGKSTMQFYRVPQGNPAVNRTVGATSTTFADGKDWSCDVNIHSPVERADLEAMAKTLDLDGQIMTLGPTMMGRWKIRKRHPIVLIKAVAGKNFTMLMVQKFEAMPAMSKAKPAH